MPGLVSRAPVPKLLLLLFAGLVRREQARAIDYFVEESRILWPQLGKRRLRLTDNQRRRLAVKGKALGGHLLGQVATLVAPDTILVWYRTLIARKWTCPRKRVGRTGILRDTRELIVRLARGNPS